MANLKNITELPVAESADGLNLIVNDNGVAKQIAASEVGAQADWNVMDEHSPAFIKNKPVDNNVKSVNGVKPDESGNVTMNIATSWNDLTDKPFYDDRGEVVLSYDPSIGGALDFIDNRGYRNLLLVSYDTPSVENIIGGIVTYAVSGEEGNTMVISPANIQQQDGAYVCTINTGNGPIVIYVGKPKEDAQAGVWFSETMGQDYVSELRYFPGKFKKIERKYIDEEYDFSYKINLNSISWSGTDFWTCVVERHNFFETIVSKLQSGTVPSIKMFLNTENYYIDNESNPGFAHRRLIATGAPTCSYIKEANEIQFFCKMDIYNILVTFHSDHTFSCSVTYESN